MNWVGLPKGSVLCLLEITVNITVSGKQNVESLWITASFGKYSSCLIGFLIFLQVQTRFFQWSFGQACYLRGRFADWNTHLWWGILSEGLYKLIRIYHGVCIEAYLLATEEKIFIIIAVWFPKEIKGSYQIPNLFWEGSDDILAPNSDFILFEAVNMWWDFLEIRWTLEIALLLLKYF